MATNTEPDDLQTILAMQRREIMAAQTLDSDFDFAFSVQIEEAVAASLADRPSSSPSGEHNAVAPAENDGVLWVAETRPQRDMESHMKKHQDRKHSEAESSKVMEYLDRRIHDERLANNIGNLPEEYWSKFSHWYEKPCDTYNASSSSLSSSSSSSKVLVEPDALKLYFKGFVSEERVGGSDMVVAGAGIAICDPGDNLLFQSGKNLEAFDDGYRISNESAELEALAEGLEKAFEFGFEKIAFFCDDDMIFLYVTNRLPPRDGKVAELVNQVTLLRRKFTYCDPSLTYCSPSVVAHDDMYKLALKCAREAIVSQTNSGLRETCLICYEDTDVAQMFSVDGCLHRYCFSCTKQHVEAKLYDGKIPRCPHDGCKSEVAIDSCAKLLPPNLVEILHERIKESAIPVRQRVYCPNPNCSALMSKDEVLKYSKASFIDAQQSGARTCMKCLKFFCINCKVPWHHSMTCDKYRRDNPHSHEDEQMLKSLAAEKKWRQCPKCSHMVELLEGCNHIKCRCKYEFCYACGAGWKNKQTICNCPFWDERNVIRNNERQQQHRLPEMDGQPGRLVRIFEQRRQEQRRYLLPPPPPQLQLLPDMGQELERMGLGVELGLGLQQQLWWQMEPPQQLRERLLQQLLQQQQQQRQLRRQQHRQQ